MYLLLEVLPSYTCHYFPFFETPLNLEALESTPNDFMLDLLLEHASITI